MGTFSRSGPKIGWDRVDVSVARALARAVRGESCCTNCQSRWLWEHMVGDLQQRAGDPVSDNQGYPRAYFITFRCYGTWLHGDARGSADRSGSHQPGQPLIPGNRGLHRRRESALAHTPTTLGTRQRAVVDEAIRGVCLHRDWELHALNVRRDHTHVVVSGQCRPEKMMTSFKAWSTRRLREAGLVLNERKVWSRHGSTRYLWNERAVEEACVYTLEAQDDRGTETKL